MRRRLASGISMGVLLSSGAFLGSTSAETVKAKTLTRTEDWVVVQGKDLPRLKGKHKDKLRLYSQKNGALEPIAFQVDEKNADGNYCFSEGPADMIVRDADQGVLDDNDELVFMCKDAGDLATETGFPAGQNAVHLIQLTDPKTKGTGWVYAFGFDDPPARSTKRYAWFDKKGETIIWHGERWFSDNEKTPQNVLRMTTLKFAREEDRTPDYSKSSSVLDCSKVTLKLKKWFKTLSWDSNDFYVKMGAYNNGPIRALCQSIMEFDLALGFKLRAKDSYIMSYANASTMPTNAELPVDISDTAGASWYTLLMDLDSRNTKGWKFYNNFNPTPVPIDGKTDEAEKKLDKRWPDWNCVYGPEGALMHRFKIPKEAVRPQNELYYLDDKAQNEGPEFEDGAVGTFGYKLDLAGVKAGIYSGDYVIWYCAPPFKQGDETKYLDIIDNPLTLKVK
jgi:hypothetical protein